MVQSGQRRDSEDYNSELSVYQLAVTEYANP